MKVWKATMFLWWEVAVMRKLLSANFARLGKDKVFWITAVAVFISSLVTIFNSSGSADLMISSGYPVTLDDYFFNHAPMMGLYYAVFISLFLGTEYSDGTIRNKLAVGHRRLDVYLANYMTCH